MRTQIQMLVAATEQQCLGKKTSCEWRAATHLWSTCNRKSILIGKQGEGERKRGKKVQEETVIWLQRPFPSLFRQFNQLNLSLVPLICPLPPCRSLCDKLPWRGRRGQDQQHNAGEEVNTRVKRATVQFVFLSEGGRLPQTKEVSK